jgi:hypothetical protein
MLKDKIKKKYNKKILINLPNLKSGSWDRNKKI